MKDVEEVLLKLTPTVRALVIVQLHSGARAGELVRMRVGDIDRTDPPGVGLQARFAQDDLEGKVEDHLLRPALP